MFGSKEQKRKVKNQFEILSIPHYSVKNIREAQSMDDTKSTAISTRHAKKNEHISITDRWHRDE